MSKTHYPTDLSNDEWQSIQPLLQGSADQTEMREIVNGMLYLARFGCTQKSLPEGLPQFETVWKQFWDLQDSGVWYLILDTLRGAASTESLKRLAA